MYTDINILLSLIQIYVEILHTSMLNKNPFPYTQVTIMCLCFAVNLFLSIYFIKNKFWGYRKKKNIIWHYIQNFIQTTNYKELC